MNRNVLKIIAVITMLIDHVGLFLFENNVVFRIIGRIAFPIFAFFIAEGWRYTRNRKRYALWLTVFAVISQIHYALLFEWYKLNILFTFLYTILIITLVELYKKETKMPSLVKNLIVTISLMTMFGFLLLTDLFGWLDYGLIGVLLVLNFYFIKNKLRYLTGARIIVLLTAKLLLFGGVVFRNFLSLFALMAIVLLLFYNGEKGKRNLKNFFYIFYPVHLMIIWLITLFI